jgi:hypothetical protein
MLFKEIIAFYFENRTKPISKLCGQNTVLLNVKAGGAYTESTCCMCSYHWALKGSNKSFRAGAGVAQSV